MAIAAAPSDRTPRNPTREPRDLLDDQRRAFLREGSPSAELRIERLDRLIASVIEHETRILDACMSDFGHRSRDASRWTDVAAIISSLKYCRKHVRQWMKPERRRPAFMTGLLGAEAEVRFQPLGVVGIVSSWNFPVYLALSPLASVLSAGNRAIIKPSEVAPAAAEITADIVRRAFNESEVAVVTGGQDVAAAFTRLPFDHMVFTGSAAVARHVMRAAADHLVPLTLELGGKCPVIVGKGANLEDVALKVLNGKCLNAGQICLAPDYVLVPAARRDQLVRAFISAAGRMYDGLLHNGDYTSVINERHRKRIEAYLQDARERGAELVELNPRDESFDSLTTNKLPPTLVLNVSDDMAIMREEIFGPALPIREYRDVEEAIDYVNAHPRPLALYYFGHDRAEREHVLGRTTSGGVTINDVMMHAVHDDLPFGGVGMSGMGAYHASEGFRRFSHARSTFTQAKPDLSGPLLRPPFGQGFRKLVSGLIKP